eukprot:10170922-Lingulodinium_polyedra.AAC.1
MISAPLSPLSSSSSPRQLRWSRPGSCLGSSHGASPASTAIFRPGTASAKLASINETLMRAAPSRFRPA